MEFDFVRGDKFANLLRILVCSQSVCWHPTSQSSLSITDIVALHVWTTFADFDALVKLAHRGTRSVRR